MSNFEFGRNWKSFVRHLTPERVEAAKQSIKELLGVEDLNGKTFLDVGCGSGLSSLAAFQLLAAVTSNDVDCGCLQCTRDIRHDFAGELLVRLLWKVEFRSALNNDDEETFDIVWCWGVVHHTGDMWTAIDHVADRVTDDGTLVLSVYNDQGWKSKAWARVKRTYNALPRLLRPLYVMPFMLFFETRAFVGRIVTGQGVRLPRRDRGMSVWHDWVDWIGGWPFEVAKPEQVIERVQRLGFRLVKLRTCGGGLGCNEFVFKRTRADLARKTRDDWMDFAARMVWDAIHGNMRAGGSTYFGTALDEVSAMSKRIRELSK